VQMLDDSKDEDLASRIGWVPETYTTETIS